MKTKLIATLIALSVIFPNSSAQAISGGESAKGHSRIVSIYLHDKYNKYDACSGFLFAPTIVITAAHCQFKPGSKTERWKDTSIYIGRPGAPVDIFSKNLVRAKKLFGYTEYQQKGQTRPRNKYNNQDFAVIVTEKPVANVLPATIMSEEEFNSLRSSLGTVIVGGYGLTSPKDREKSHQGAFPKTLNLKFINEEEYLKIISGIPDRDFFAPTGDPFEKWGYVKISKEIGTTCDGDSGAGFFIQKNNKFVYVGLNAWPIGGPNCLANQKWGKYGGVNRVDPAYYHQELINKAIQYSNALTKIKER